MRKIVFYGLLIVLTGEIVYLGVNYFLKPKSKVLAEATVIQPTPSDTPVPTLSPKPTTIPIKTPKPSQSPKPTPVSSQQINGFIDQYSSQYGLDPNFVRHVALCESGFNPMAVNGPYVGLFQFAATTWQNVRREMGKDTNINLRYSAEDSISTATYSLSKNKNTLWPECGI